MNHEYHYEAVNVESQQQNPYSLLWWMKRVIDLRKRHKAFGRGDLEILEPDNRKVLAFIRRYGDETILVVANLSRFVQYAQLDLRGRQGAVPVEMFGRTAFPPVGGAPYFLTLGPHSFYWLLLERPRSGHLLTDKSAAGSASSLPEVKGAWKGLSDPASQRSLAAVLPDYLGRQSWGGGGKRSIRAARVMDAIPVPCDDPEAHIVLCVAENAEGDPETYVLPMSEAWGAWGDQLAARVPPIATIRGSGQDGLLYDPLGEPGFAAALLECMAEHRRLKGRQGTLVATPGGGLRRLYQPGKHQAEVNPVPGVHRHSSVILDGRLVLKLYRRTGSGINPELEMGRFLTEKVQFPYVAPVVGSLEYRPEGGRTRGRGNTARLRDQPPGRLELHPGSSQPLPAAGGTPAAP